MQWYIILTTGCFIADFTVTPQGRTKSRNQTAKSSMANGSTAVWPSSRCRCRTAPFEGDIFWHKLYKKYYVVVYDLLEGFHLEPADGGDEYLLSWFFGLMRHKGTLWNSPKDFPEKALKKFHEERSADTRVEAIRF